MANEIQLEILGRGVAAWNKWRGEHPGKVPNLADADLRGISLFNADFSITNLSGADLTDATLIGTDFSGADLTDAVLCGADLAGANLSGANLTGADLSAANLLTWAGPAPSSSSPAGTGGCAPGPSPGWLSA